MSNQPQSSILYTGDEVINHLHTILPPKQNQKQQYQTNTPLLNQLDNKTIPSFQNPSNYQTTLKKSTCPFCSTLQFIPNSSYMCINCHNIVEEYHKQFICFQCFNVSANHVSTDNLSSCKFCGAVNYVA